MLKKHLLPQMPSMSNYPINPTHQQFTNQPRNGVRKLTLVLIGINVALFALQALSGVDISDPLTRDALRWGADYAPLTYLAEPYRLFSSMFFHFGFMHLLMNMWALFVFGNIAEQTFGKVYYLGLYILAGLAGNLLSGYVDILNSYAFLQQPSQDLIPHVSAGASGAVMGLGGALTALSFFRPVPYLDRKSLLIIMIANLGFGFFATGINNMAHIGGMLMGVFMALTWHFSQKTNTGIISIIVLLIISTTICFAFYQYNQHLIQGLIPLWQDALIQMKTHLAF